MGPVSKNRLPQYTCSSLSALPLSAVGPRCFSAVCFCVPTERRENGKTHRPDQKKAKQERIN